jgi:hypothetical protein
MKVFHQARVTLEREHHPGPLALTHTALSGNPFLRIVLQACSLYSVPLHTLSRITANRAQTNRGVADTIICLMLFHGVAAHKWMWCRKMSPRSRMSRRHRS